MCEINIVYRDTLCTSFWYYIRVSIFSPSAFNQFSLPCETGRYTYIHGSSFFSPHFLHCFSLLFLFSPFPSRSFQSSIGEKYIFVHRARNHHRRLRPPHLIVRCSPLTRTHSYIFPAALIHCIRSEVRHEARFSP